VRAVSGDNVFLLISLNAEHEVRMCSTVNGDLQWSQDMQSSSQIVITSHYAPPLG